VNEKPPKERIQTVRQELREVLRGPPATARDLSALLRISEREVLEHLPHVADLSIEPAECKACGFVFDERTRAKKPSRCPECKSERITPPRFRVAED
jgi:predicted Zn-ribbon and HTH transcriptional regulator